MDERSAWFLLSDLWSNASPPHVGGVYQLYVNDQLCVGLCSAINALSITQDLKDRMVARLPGGGASFAWPTETITGKMGRMNFCLAMAELLELK